MKDEHSVKANSLEQFWQETQGLLIDLSCPELCQRERKHSLLKISAGILFVLLLFILLAEVSHMVPHDSKAQENAALPGYAIDDVLAFGSLDKYLRGKTYFGSWFQRFLCGCMAPSLWG
jgi:hypothetical protein